MFSNATSACDRADSPGGVRSENETTNADDSRNSAEESNRRVRGCWRRDIFFFKTKWDENEKNMGDVLLVVRRAQTIRLTFALVSRWSLLHAVWDLRGGPERATVPLSLGKTASKTTTRRVFSPLTVFVVYVTWRDARARIAARDAPSLRYRCRIGTPSDVPRSAKWTFSIDFSNRETVSISLVASVLVLKDRRSVYVVRVYTRACLAATQVTVSVWSLWRMNSS